MLSSRKQLPPPETIIAADDILRRCFIGRIAFYDLAATKRHSGRIIPIFQYTSLITLNTPLLFVIKFVFVTVHSRSKQVCLTIHLV